MIESLHINDLNQTLKKQWDGGNAVLIIGSTGIGKTSLIRNAVRELGMGLVEFNLLGELKEAYMDGIIRNIEKAKGANGIALFFDNLNKVKPESLLKLKDIIKNRSIGEFALIDKIKIISAGTSGIGYETKDYNLDTNSSNLEEYFTIIKIDGDSLLSVWLKWARMVKLHPYVISFIEKSPEYLHYAADEENWAVPASWETASKYIRYLQKNNTPIDFILDSVGYSHIGKPAFDSFKEFVLSTIKR